MAYAANDKFLTAAAPGPAGGAAVASVTTASSTVAAAYDRIALIITNTGSNPVSIGLGATAVAGRGIVLPASQSVPFVLSGFSGAVYAITGTGSSTLAIAEY